MVVKVEVVAQNRPKEILVVAQAVEWEEAWAT
jgi:hypothetical protein